LYSPVLLAILFMLPRLLSPQFELFDAGRALVTAQKISSGTWYTGADSIEGRFRPVHWLWFTLSYLADGSNPLWFFLANTLALLIITGGTVFLVHAVSGSRLQAWLAGILLLSAGPVVEGFYTIKGEVVQLALMVLALLIILAYARAGGKWKKAALVAAAALVLLLAALAKETTIVLLPISLVWYLSARFWPARDRNAARTGITGAFLVANLLSVPAFFLLRSAAISDQLSEGTYTSRYTFQLGQLATSALRWAGWLVRDFSWVVPLLLLALLAIITSRRAAGARLLFDSAVWMAAWICVYLPWNFMAEYYMLPFALGLAVLASGLAVETARLLGGKSWQRWAAAAGVGLSAVLMLGSLLNNRTNAAVQLAVNSVDASAMSYLVNETGSRGTILVNIQDSNEYVYEMRVQLQEVYGRPDLEVDTFSSDMPRPEGGTNVYIAAPYVINQPLLTVRMGIIEESQNLWSADLEEYLRAHPGWGVVYEHAETLRLSDVNYPRLFCPFVETRAFCASPVPLLDARLFTYGWRIYRWEAP
jgi:hypothetical protein